MNRFRSIAVLLAFLAVLAVGCFGQTALTQTTLSASVNGGVLYSGETSSIDTTVTVASTTGIVARTLGGSAITFLYIDREAMGVIAVNTTTKVVTVTRGDLGTQVGAHVTGTMVLLLQTNIAGQNALFQSDPPAGKCTAANTTTTPWVNVITSAQWLCSTVTLTWVPGFGNPGNSAYPPGVTTAVASVAGATLPSGPLFHTTGTNAITSWTVPVGFNGTAAGGGSFCTIPDAIFTWTAAGNIALAGTAVVNKLLCFQWDATNSKWVPSYIA